MGTRHVLSDPLRFQFQRFHDRREALSLSGGSFQLSHETDRAVNSARWNGRSESGGIHPAGIE